jgi:hypothetical protein
MPDVKVPPWHDSRNYVTKVEPNCLDLPRKLAGEILFSHSQRAIYDERSPLAHRLLNIGMD